MLCYALRLPKPHDGDKFSALSSLKLLHNRFVHLLMSLLQLLICSVC